MAQHRDSFPDFDHFIYKIALRPAASILTAWSKLEEAERRLTIYKWAETKNDPRTPQHRILLNDAVSAFLLTFEATIQFSKNQVPKTRSGLNFDDWLSTFPENDVLVRGLRTLRHFEAHVESKPPPRIVRLFIGGSLPGGTSETEVSTSWKLPPIQTAELNKLRNPPLQNVDLNDWNKIVETMDAQTIFEQGLIKLQKIIDIATSVI